jgi:hypothetical protein
MKELNQMAWRSRLYSFINDKSDMEFVIVRDSLDDPELEKFKDNPDFKIFSKEQFQKALDSHNIKALGNYIFTFW